MRIIGNDPSVPRQTQEIASGTLPSGTPVVVNADGTVSVVAQTAESLGSATTFESAESSSIASTFDSNSNKVVIAYRDYGNSNYGTAIVGTVSGTSISFGTPAVFYSDSSYGISGDRGISATFDSSNSKVVFAFQESRNGTGKAVVGTVSGTSISFGSAVSFDSGVQVTEIHTTFDSSNNKVVIAYRDGNNSSYGTAIVGTVSGTSISFGTAVVFQSALTNHISTTFDSNSNKVIIAYRDNTSAGYGEVTVGTVSGTSISFGSQYIFSTQSSGGISETAVVFDSNVNKIVVAWQDGTDSNKGAAVVGTVSGTAVTFGDKVFFETGSTTFIESAFDASANKIVIAYKDTSNSNYGTYAVGTVSGTSITFDTPVVFEEAYVQFTIPTYDSNAERIVISFQDVGNSQYGKSIVLRNGSTNLTSENYIGMSSGTAFQTGSAAVTGSETVFEAATSRYVVSTYDTNANRVVVSYVDNGNSSYGTAIVGTVSGSSISFGSPVVFETAEVQDQSIIFDSNSNKIVIAYRDAGNSNYGTAIVGTVSGTSISFGSAVVFATASTAEISATFDSSNNKVVIAYKDAGNSDHGTAIVGTVSGTSISFGSEVVFESAAVAQVKTAFDTSSNKVVIVYQDQGNSNYGTAIIGTVSGTSISFGTAVVYLAANAQSNGVPVIDTDTSKVIISYKDNGNSNYGTARVGTVSGTSISFGTAVVFNSGTTQLYTGQAYHSSLQKTVIAYRDDSDNTDGNYNVGTVSGTDISFSGEVTFNSGRTDNSSLIYDPDSTNLVVSFEDNANSSHGTSLVFSPSTLVTTRGQVADGGHALVDTQGAISDNQTGLTAGQSYYVQDDGTISTTAGDPSVFAGTAVSATKLIVKG